MEKINKRALRKIGDITEIIMVMLNCSYLDAFAIVTNSDTGKAIIEGDMATIYQSAPCCVEDIGREFRQHGNDVYADQFSNEYINQSISIIRNHNIQNRLRYEKKVI